VFGREPPTKNVDLQVVVRLAAFVKVKVLGDSWSLKLKWIQFVWFSFEGQKLVSGNYNRTDVRDL
jgi:hypothetical protein